MLNDVEKLTRAVVERQLDIGIDRRADRNHCFISGKFDESIPFFYILLGGWVFRSFSYLRGGGLIGLGKIEYNFYGALIILPINFIIQYFMISKYGVWGAAISNTFIGIITFFVVWVLFNKGIKKHSNSLK